MRLFRRQRKFTKAKSHFLPIFNQQAALGKQSASALYALVRTDDRTEWMRLEKEVKQCEIQGDALIAEFYETIYENLLYPTDRDDLQILAIYIDEFLDNINDSAKSVLLYLPERIDAQLVELAQYIESETDALKDLVTCLDNVKANFSKLTLLCDRITELEHAADDAYEEYIGFIFQTEKNKTARRSAPPLIMTETTPQPTPPAF